MTQDEILLLPDFDKEDINNIDLIVHTRDSFSSFMETSPSSVSQLQEPPQLPFLLQRSAMLLLCHVPAEAGGREEPQYTALTARSVAADVDEAAGGRVR